MTKMKNNHLTPIQFDKISWEDEVVELWLENDGFINICYEAIDRHLTTDLQHAIAIRYLPPGRPDQIDRVIELTYQNLAVETYKFAHVLEKLGINKGDTVFSLSPRCPELYIAAMGTLRFGGIFSPLFSAFGPQPILSRMKKGKARVLFSTSSLFRKKVLPVLGELPELKHIILIDDDSRVTELEGVMEYQALIQAADTEPFLEKTQPMDLALLHFTSGTTGEPKGAMHVHQAVVYHKISSEYALDLKARDVFWCTADPGWVTGTSYGIIAPLCVGATLLIDGAEFNPVRWYEILQKHNVDIWYTAPTALRMLMRAGIELPSFYDFSHVRFAASVGEPLNPEVVNWAQKHLHLLIHDNWWQTETGGIIICNDAKIKVKSGSMGKPIPGLQIALIKSHNNGQIIFSAPGEEGEIAIHKGWPSMLQGYLDNPERYARSFVGDWYLSGDLARVDGDGFYWFVGRIDDVIKTSGHLVGPFEVENILMEHPSVLESAVIGMPDSVAGEMIQAFVVLKNRAEATEEKKLDILIYARKKLGIAVAPREIKFIDNLPKTRSGKIMRRLLKARELGLPDGDLSTLENPNG
jgi:acetyl-CoA synthetase